MNNCYSINGEVFHDDYLSFFKRHIQYNNIGEYIEFWVADKKEVLHSDVLDVEDIFEGLYERSYDIAGDFCRPYLDDVSSSKKEELSLLIVDWFNKNASQPEFYKIDNRQKYRAYWNGEGLSDWTKIKG